MKTILFFSHSLLLFFLMSPSRCDQAEYSNDTRIFVEGKVISANTAGVQIKLISDNILISETKPLADGTFKLGGPGTTAYKTLSFGKKIKSFSAIQPDCRLSNDSLNIILPSNKTYIKFTQITIEP